MTSKRQRKKERSAGRSRTARSKTDTRRGRLRREFSPDYSYVKKDLRRIGLLTGTFLTILIILTFFLR